MMVAQVRGYQPCTRASVTPLQALFDSRVAYLNAWAQLDGLLVSRLGNGSQVVAFGIGETANLLRAYAPEAWSRVSHAVVDLPTPIEATTLPVLTLGQLQPNSDLVILLAVRPRVQQTVAARLKRAGLKVVSWDDWIRD
jgi:hypothetical protein